MRLLKAIILFFAALLLAEPAYADGGLTLTISPPIQDNQEQRGKNMITLVDKEDHFHVVLGNRSGKEQSISYSTCSDPLIHRLFFRVKDDAEKNYTVQCGNIPDDCLKNVLVRYPLLPKESIVFDISLASCHWETLPKSLTSNESNRYADMKAVFRLDGSGQTVETKWKRYEMQIDTAHSNN